MSKYYFSEHNKEMCYTLAFHLDMMESDGITELKLFEAKRITGEGCFYCRMFATAGEAGDGSCGKMCEEYIPRNGKSGRCKHSGYCYEQTDKQKIIKL